MKSAPRIILTDEHRQTLTRWSRGRSTPVRLMQRAKIVLLAAEGTMNKDIAAQLGIMPNTVGRWRARFAAGGLGAIEKDVALCPQVQVCASHRPLLESRIAALPESYAQAESGANRSLTPRLASAEDGAGRGRVPVRDGASSGAMPCARVR